MKKYPKVYCAISRDLTENDDGRWVPCTFAECSKCEHRVMSYGDGPQSELRCLTLPHKECPRSENN